MKMRELLRRETGLNLSAAIVERAVAERVAILGLDNAQAYPDAPTQSELKALVELVVVPESWMFRDAEAFTAATAEVRERLAAHPARTVRILSVPCAGGEEPYSMAMALCDAGVPRTGWQIEAIDLSDVALARARAGLFTRNAFRGAAIGFRERYFTAVGNDFQISDDLRTQVAFAQGNLLTLDITAGVGRYDIIFCRNLLIYFDTPTTALAVGRLATLLADDGILFAGYAEVPAFCASGFVAARRKGAFAVHKERRSAARTEVAALPVRQPRKERAAPPPASAPVRRMPAAPPAPKPLAPQDAAALLACASRQAGLGDYAGAAASCHAALKIDAAAADAYFILGMVSECQKKPGVADEYWRRCVYLQPDHYEALCHLALLSEHNGDAAEALRFKQRAARVYQRQQGKSP